MSPVSHHPPLRPLLLCLFLLLRQQCTTEGVVKITNQKMDCGCVAYSSARARKSPSHSQMGMASLAMIWRQQPVFSKRETGISQHHRVS